MAIFQMESRVRYSETDADGFLTPIGILDLFQDCSNFQSADLGIGVDYLRANHRAWVLSSWQLCITKRPKLADRIIIETWSHDIKLALGYRNFALRDINGDLLACANSLWAYLDTQQLKPAIIPPDVAELYGRTPKIDMAYAPRKIAIPDNMVRMDDFEVKYYFLDTNKHMNNSKYVMAAMEFVPEDFEIHEIRADYKKAAYYKEIVTPMVNISDASVIVALYDSEGALYATVQFL